MILNIIFLVIFYVIIVFIISIRIGEKNSKTIDDMMNTIDNINFIWNMDCPLSESVEKHKRHLYAKDKVNDTAYKTWIERVPDEYPYQYLNQESVKHACHGDSMARIPLRRLIGELNIMSTNGQFYGNFYFMGMVLFSYTMSAERNTLKESSKA